MTEAGVYATEPQMTVEVANVRDLPPHDEWPEWYAYVGRPAPRCGLKGSALANPFKVGQWPTRFPMSWTLTLEDTVYWYRVWLHTAPQGMKMFEMEGLRRKLKKHGRLTLVCWCETWDGTGEAPGKCHAEVLREALLKRPLPAPTYPAGDEG